VSIWGLGRQGLHTEKDGQDDGEPLESTVQSAPDTILDLIDDLAPLVDANLQPFG
jgi:hypothetical protein